jgi:hypothetical protein
MKVIAIVSFLLTGSIAGSFLLTNERESVTFRVTDSLQLKGNGDAHLEFGRVFKTSNGFAAYNLDNYTPYFFDENGNFTHFNAAYAQPCPPTDESSRFKNQPLRIGGVVALMNGYLLFDHLDENQAWYFYSKTGRFEKKIALNYLLRKQGYSWYNNQSFGFVHSGRKSVFLPLNRFAPQYSDEHFTGFLVGEFDIKTGRWRGGFGSYGEIYRHKKHLEYAGKTEFCLDTLNNYLFINAAADPLITRINLSNGEEINIGEPPSFYAPSLFPSFTTEDEVAGKYWQAVTESPQVEQLFTIPSRKWVCRLYGLPAPSGATPVLCPAVNRPRILEIFSYEGKKIFTGDLPVSISHFVFEDANSNLWFSSKYLGEHSAIPLYCFSIE